MKDVMWNVQLLLEAVNDEFDGSEYQQGVKDGIRRALIVMGDPQFAWLINKFESPELREYHKTVTENYIALRTQFDDEDESQAEIA